MVTYSRDNDFYLVNAEKRTFLYHGIWDSHDPQWEPAGK